MAEEQDKNAKLKRILTIILVIIIFLATTSLIAYFVATNVMSDDDDYDDEEVVNGLRESGEIVQIGDFLTNLADTGYIKLHIEIEVDSSDVKEEVEDRKSEIQDKIISIIRTKASDEVSGRDGMDELRRNINFELNNMLREGQVIRVYFTDMIVH